MPKWCKVAHDKGDSEFSGWVEIVRNPNRHLVICLRPLIPQNEVQHVTD